MPGETSNNQSNFNKHKVSLYAHLYEKYVEIKNVDGTVEITPDKYTWYNGGVVLEYVDRRPQPTCTGKRILLRQDMASLWDDVLRMNQTAGGTWTQEMAIQVESQLLLAMHPTIDLDPNSTLQDMKKYDPANGPVVHVHRELKTRKRKLNSYELEQEAAKKAKKEQMMFMMDERHGREFKPTFKLLPYFKSNRNRISTVGKGKQRVDIEAEQVRSSSASAKKSGRKLVRQLKFERSFTEAGDRDKVHKLFTLLYIYQDANGKHEAIFHSLNEKDLRTEGKYNAFMQTIDEGKEYKLDDSRASYRNELGDAEGYKSFIKSFVVLYSIDNNLKYDSERVDKVPVEMLTEVTTELTSPQTEMKFDNMQPYKIIELLAQQSPNAENTTSSNEGAKDLSVADLYNAAAKKAMQAKPSVSVPVNQDSSLMPPPPRPPARRNSRNGNSRARQTATTQAQISTPVQNQNIGNSQMTPQFLIRTGNQTPVQQQIPQTQMQQPQVMAASQSPSQRPMQSPALIPQNVPIQVPQSSTDGIRPVPQQISIPTIARQVQIPNAQGMQQQHAAALMQRHLAAQAAQSGIPNVRQIPPVRIIQNLPVNSRPTANQSIAQGTTIQDMVASPSMLNTRQKAIPVRRTTQGQSQQMNIPVQQTSQMNISAQTNSSQMPQINIPTQPTTSHVQSQMNQAQPAQINIPSQISDQQQTQTTPRIPGRGTPQMSAQTQMNQAPSTPQINIPAQMSDPMQTTPRINPAQVPQVNATDQMNAQISQMRMNQNIPARMNHIQQQYQLQQLIMANPNIRFSQPYTNAMTVQQIANGGYIRTPTAGVMNMQQSFMPSGQTMMMQSSFPMQSQLLPGQPGGIRPQQIPPQMRQFLRPHMIMRQNPMISQQININQQLQNHQWIFQQSQNQLPQQPQNQNWNGDGNASGKQ